MTTRYIVKWIDKKGQQRECTVPHIDDAMAIANGSGMPGLPVLVAKVTGPGVVEVSRERTRH